MNAIPVLWGEPLGFCVGFEPALPEGLEVDPPVPLLADDGCPSERAACFYSGDDLIVRVQTEPPSPVQHPRLGELWPQPDSLLFRSQAELDAWASDMGL